VSHQKLIRQKVAESVRVKQQFSDDLFLAIEQAAEKIIASYSSGGKLILCGNGGSAADAQHFACELVGRFLQERRPLFAVALNTNSSVLTCLGNDYGYEHIFERQVQAMARPEDTVIGISTSGDSPNVLSALLTARQMGCSTIGMTGFSGGAIKDVVDILLNVPSSETPRIQESHVLIGHIICELVELSVREQ
jgi:D-sedoheptulose 7-phosphate isomerase